jgi:hypothetical protein
MFSLFISLFLISLSFIEAGVALTTEIQTAQPITHFSIYDKATRPYGTMGGEYLPNRTNIDEIFTSQSPSTSNTDIQLSAFRKRGTTVAFNVRSGAKAGKATIPLLSYPHYQARGIYRDYKIEKSANNIIEIVIPANTRDTITVSFVQPLSWTLAWCISLIAWIVISTLIFFQHSHRRTMLLPPCLSTGHIPSHVKTVKGRET